MLNRTACAWIAGALLLAGTQGAFAAEPEPCDAKADFSVPQWHADCDAAIAQERNTKNRAVLLQRRAYVAVEQYRYPDALADLNEALKANPECADCLHERAYLNSELGEYAAAIADLDREIALKPEFAAAYRERAYARTFNGDLEGAYSDRARTAELEPDSSGAVAARGKAALWVGRFDDADADLKRAEELARAAGDDETAIRAAEKRAEISLWKASSGDKDAAGRCVMQGLRQGEAKVNRLIGDCTQAFLAAKDGPAKAEALTTRSTAWMMLDGNWDRTTDDRRVAVGLDPGNPEWRSNLGYAYIAVRHSRAAVPEFDRALAKGPSWIALAGRAQARNNIDDTKGAEQDALASMKLQPNAPAAWVLADIAFERGEKERARQMYLAAYKLGSRDDRLMARLKELGVDDPEKASLEAAK